ncbi:hypothetical protein ACQE98_17520 [Ornithinimicrobium sp. W1679]|uniref:hypothetical protein n=1 Tax=Ornithinimicrobium sp. W1679 TaxID=3418770 RepID=UPI003CF710A4
MSSKVSPAAIITDHYATLRNHTTERWSPLDLAVMVALPVAVAVGMAWFNFRIVEFGQLIGGVSILTGFAFGLLIFVFQLRLEARRDGSAPRGGILAELLNELFTNLAYACLVGLALVAMLVIGGAIGPAMAGGVDATLQLGRVSSAAVAAVGSHFLLTLMMCVKRAYVAFDRSVRHT